MKIKKVEVCGFKSFVDRTVVKIDHDVTAIVGPNGCGKSNIVDAIRWAMGEQSARHLRGKMMEDVIFNGCETRGPHSFAEVTLTFDNSDGLAPPEYRDYAEIAVTRRLDRSGQSEYLINKTPVRLMDVTQLFLGTGAGTKAYSIIEQGRVGFIVSAKASERRHLIEEAAGITKFKAKKKAAERKMEQTRQNLLRVGDIVGEIERSLASLKRQAQKAERYKRYKAEIRDLELHVASHRWLELSVGRRLVRQDLDRAEGAVEGQRMGLALREAELGADRLSLAALEDRVEAAQRVAYERDNEVGMLGGRLDNLRQRLEAAREQETVSERERAALARQRDGLIAERDGLRRSLIDLEAAEAAEQELLARETRELDERREATEQAEGRVAEARSRVGEATARIARAEAVVSAFDRRREEGRARLERLHREVEELAVQAVETEQGVTALGVRLAALRTGKVRTGERRQELETELAGLQEAIRDSDGTLEALRQEVAERRSRLRSLEEIQERFEGLEEGPRAVMTRYAPDAAARDERGVLGLVADRVECDPQLTDALAAALGDRLQDIVVADRAAAEGVVAFLSGGEHGRARTVPRYPRRVVRPSPAPPAGAVGWLTDLVTSAPEDRGLVRHLLDGVLVVEDLAAARRLHDGGLAATLVTRSGEVLAPDGALTAGRGERVGAHLIEVKREVRELRELVGDLDHRLAAAVAQHGELRNAIAERRAALEVARGESHDADIAIVKVDKDLRRAQDELEGARARRVALQHEAEELEAQLAAAEDEQAEARGEVDAAEQARRAAEEALQAAEEIALGRKQDLEEKAQVVTAVRVRAAEARQRAESDRGALARLDRSLGEVREREVRIRADLLLNAEQQGRAAGQAFSTGQRKGEVEGEALDAHGTLRDARERYDRAREDLGHREATLAGLRREAAEAEKALSSLVIREHDLAKDLDHLLATIRGRHRVELPTVIADYHDRDAADAAVNTRIDELHRLVDRMGEINLTAIEEYEEKTQRFEYLTAQQRDLERALGQLDRAIRQMNRESRRLFAQTFEAISARFTKIFPMLFGGGRAELKLTDPQDMLETGVEIVAQPPGKRLGSIELMSGGEKALTAVSLIFSIFQHRPSPFCLLDEVDAPLDEANIGRFAEAIRSMTQHSQFILITHSKATMQMADVLYGVTMETPGISKMVAVEIRARAGAGVDEGSRVA
ncbi:MAG: chromosome segregation protein SMC [Sandaracinaceae bacterium]